jgi:hypothetical protein
MGFAFSGPPTLSVIASRVADFAKDASMSGIAAGKSLAGQLPPATEGSWLPAEGIRFGPHAEDGVLTSSAIYVQAGQHLDVSASAREFGPLSIAPPQTSLLPDAEAASIFPEPSGLAAGADGRENPMLVHQDHGSVLGQAMPARGLAMEGGPYKAFPFVVATLNPRGIAENDQPENDSVTERHNSPGSMSLGSLASNRNAPGNVQVPDMLDNRAGMGANNFQRLADGSKANANSDRVVSGSVPSVLVNESRAELAGLCFESPAPTNAASVSFHGDGLMARVVREVSAAPPSEHAGTTDGDLPQVADLIARTSPYDLSVLNVALAEFLDNLEISAGQPLRVGFEIGWMPSLAAIALSTATIGMGQQLFRGAGRELPLGSVECSSGLRFRRPREVVPL